MWGCVGGGDLGCGELLGGGGDGSWRGGLLGADGAALAGMRCGGAMPVLGAIFGVASGQV